MIFEKKHIKENKIAYAFIILLSCILLFKYFSFYLDVSSLPYSQIYLKKSNENSEKLVNPDYVSIWGAYGDFIGGTLNPLFTFISIIFLGWTIIQNNKSIKINSTELKLSRKANQISSKAQSSIEKTQSLQQFDSIFFSLLNQLNAYAAKLNETKPNKKNTILEEAYNAVFNDSQGIYADRYLSLHERRIELLNHKDINQYFIFLYQLLKNTRDRLNENKSLKKNVTILKNNYGNIVRASICPELLQLLVINILNEFNDYKDLVEEFRFFEHMPFTQNYLPDLNLPLLSALQYFPEKTFDKSVYYEELKHNSIFKLYFSRNNVDTLDKFENSIFNKINDKKFEINLTEYGEVLLGNKTDDKYHKVFFKIINNKLNIYRDSKCTIRIKFNSKVVKAGLLVYIDSNVSFIINSEDPLLILAENNNYNIDTVISC